MQRLREEKITPGLNVNIKWWPDRKVFYRGKIVRKLRKNWLVEMEDRNFEDGTQVSVPADRLSLNVSFTKEGRPLMATKEDHQYAFSKEHIDYFNSMTMEEGSNE
jgi:hypothetical protein